MMIWLDPWAIFSHRGSLTRLLYCIQKRPPFDSVFVKVGAYIAISSESRIVLGFGRTLYQTENFATLSDWLFWAGGSGKMEERAMTDNTRPDEATTVDRRRFDALLTRAMDIAGGGTRHRE